MFGRLELEWCERKILLGWLELEWCERKILFGWSWSNKPNAVEMVHPSVRMHAKVGLDWSVLKR